MYYTYKYIYQNSYKCVYTNIHKVNTQIIVCITSYKYKYYGMNMNVII